jgi:hypothetical protein
MRLICISILEVSILVMLFLATMKKKSSEEPVSRGMLDEAVQTILHGMDNLIGNLRG